MKLLTFALIAALLAGCTAKQAVPDYETPPDTTPDGLVKTDNEFFDLVYIRPETDLKRFTKLQIRPIAVTYGKQDPDFRLNENQQRRVSDAFARAFSRAMTEDGRFTLTDAPGPGVLRFNIALAELTVSAQRVGDSDQAHLHLEQAGRITLVAEAVDSVSGHALVRGRDTRVLEGDKRTSTAQQHLALEVGDVFRAWADELRSGIDQLSLN